MRRLAVLAAVVASAACAGAKRAGVAAQETDTTSAPLPDTAAAGESPWIDSTIARLERAPVQNPPGIIVRYTYKGIAAYSIPSGCCDQFGYLYSASGAQICAPSGGISGRGDGRCPDFAAEARDQKVIWRDTRTTGGP